MRSFRKLSTVRLTALMAALTGFAKLLGFLREMVLANYFGAGSVTDAYVTALSIPNNLMAAAISAVGLSYVPLLAQKKEKQGRAAEDLFTGRVLNLQLAAVAAVTALGCVFARSLVHFFAPGFAAETAALTAWYLRIALFNLFFNVLIYIFNAWLNCRGVYVPQTVCAALQNLLQVAFVAASAWFGYKTLIFGPLLALAFTGVCHVLFAKKNGFVYTLSFQADDAVREVLRMAVPVFVGGYVNQINLTIDRMLASDLQEGCVSALNYSNQIINAITALTVTVFLNILYPRLAEAFVKEDTERISDLSLRSIRLIWVLMLPLSMGLVCYADDAIRFLFERGAFDGRATALTGSALLWYAPGLVFASLNSFISRIYYAMHDSKTPMLCSVFSVLINIALNFALIKSMGHGGLALATSLAAAAYTVFLLAALRRRCPQIKTGRLAKPLLLMTAAALLSIVPTRMLYGAWGGGFAKLVLCAGLAVLLYLLLLYLLRLEEPGLLRQLLPGSGKKTQN